MSVVIPPLTLPQSLPCLTPKAVRLAIVPASDTAPATVATTAAREAARYQPIVLHSVSGRTRDTGAFEGVSISDSKGPRLVGSAHDMLLEDPPLTASDTALVG
jgi:hypothetical protein